MNELRVGDIVRYRSAPRLAILEVVDVDEQRVTLRFLDADETSSTCRLRVPASVVSKACPVVALCAHTTLLEGVQNVELRRPENILTVDVKLPTRTHRTRFKDELEDLFERFDLWPELVTLNGSHAYDPKSRAQTRFAGRTRQEFVAYASQFGEVERHYAHWRVDGIKVVWLCVNRQWRIGGNRYSPEDFEVGLAVAFARRARDRGRTPHE